MGQGDLDYKVELEGNDEITAIAESLEELRQRSIRVVRLNLVEKLAQDLESKNAELEDVLDQLRSAQDQIVTRQKLAELGELARRGGTRNQKSAELRSQLRGSD